MTDDFTWRVRAKVGRIIDGDTFVLDELDLGWGTYRREISGAHCRVRLLNYDSPERSEPRYAEATNLLAAILPPGTLIWLTSHSLDSFGRILATVNLMDGTSLLSLLPPEWLK